MGVYHIRQITRMLHSNLRVYQHLIIIKLTAHRHIGLQLMFHIIRGLIQLHGQH